MGMDAAKILAVRRPPTCLRILPVDSCPLSLFPI